MTAVFETTDIINATDDGFEMGEFEAVVIAAGVIVAGGTTTASDSGLISQRGNNSIDVQGMVWGGSYGIMLDVGNDTIAVGTGGNVTGNLKAGIEITGTYNFITNDGEIAGAAGAFGNVGGPGIELDSGGNSTVTNLGLISGDSGVVFSGATNVLTNSGTIEAFQRDGVDFVTTANMADTVDNSGAIQALTGGANAIADTGAGTMAVTNSGEINATVGILFDGLAGTDTLYNSGAIVGANAAVIEDGAAALFVSNSGEIKGGTGVFIAAPPAGGADTFDNTGQVLGAQIGVLDDAGANLILNNSGSISGEFAIQVDGAVDTIDNTGTIRAIVNGGFAILESGGVLSVTNTGHIVGDISNVTNYDGTLGSVTGWVTGGSGTNTFTGGTGTDHFDGGTGVSVLDGMGGNDVLMAEGVKTTIDGGDGNDTINMASFFNAADRIDGGTGNDQLTLNGNYAAGVTLGSDTLVNVEKIVLDAGFNYNLTTDDATVAAGARLTVDASALGAGQELTFNGSAETDGHFLITGGAANDVLIGGAGNDTLIGGGDNNKFTGGLGADHIVATYAEHDGFIYNDVNDSTGLAHDVITDFSATVQTFDLDVTVTGINSEITSGKLTASNFDANLATAVSATHLAAGHAVLFAPTTGSFAGHTFLIVDANGVAGYQAGQDYVFDLVTAAHLNQLAVTDFI
jgi:Ca2+-binding RTX toxin-like protein